MKTRVTSLIKWTYLKTEKYKWNDMYKNVQNIARHMQNVKYVVYFQKTVEELHQIPIQSQWHHVWLDLVKMPQSILGNN